MRLYHVTPATNADSIQRRGLLVAKAQKPADRCIWLCTSKRILWALRHVIELHKTTALTVFEVEVPRSQLIKVGGHYDGLWRTRTNVPPEAVRLP